MFEYGFVERVDYLAITKKLVTVQGNTTTKTDYYLKMDMAKEVSMIQRNEKGKQARQFFIQAENVHSLFWVHTFLSVTVKLTIGLFIGSPKMSDQ